MMARFGFKQILLLLIVLSLLAAALSFGTFYFPADELVSRRGGQLSFIPQDLRLKLVEYRLLIGICASFIFLLFSSLWLGVEIVARLWQKSRNRELAANAVLFWACSQV